MILHVLNSSLVSGPETLVLPALRNLGEKTQIAFLSEVRKGADAALPVRYARELGLSAFEVKVRKRVDPRALAELRREIKFRKPRIVHAHDVKASVYAGLSSLPGRDWKLISTHHGVERVGLKLKLYERFYSSWILRFFDRTLAVSTFDYDLLIQRGFRKDKIRIHFNGIDRIPLSPEERASRSQGIRALWGLRDRGIREGAFIMGMAARLEPEKNHFKSLDVFQALHEKEPNLPWAVLCFGGGSLKDRLCARTLQSPLRDRVHWMGYRERLGDEMAGFDLLLSFSIHEGLPINLLEAGWAGTPIAASRAGGIPDLVRPGIEGDLLPEKWTLDQAAELLLMNIKSPLKLKKHGKALQVRVSNHFSEKAWLDKLHQIYEELS